MSHAWVNLTYTPVLVEAQTDGSLHTYTTELSEEVARDDGVLICLHCSEPLSTDNYDGVCPNALD